MEEPLELLDQILILSRMDHRIREKLNDLKIEASIDSTNSALQQMPSGQQHGTAILAEQQEAGRGRRGRRWHSPHGRNLYLSLGWKFDQLRSELGCLSLVLALSVSKALNRAGLEGHSIKWPNDILLDRRKLAGCLVEVQGESRGSCNAVLGVGINVHMPVSEATSEIDQPWTDVESHLSACSRNSLAALLLEEMILQLSLFAEQGFAPFRAAWHQNDGLKGQLVDVVAGTQKITGVATGIDGNGALLLDTGDDVLSLYSAEVSLKPRWNQ